MQATSQTLRIQEVTHNGNTFRAANAKDSGLSILRHAIHLSHINPPRKAQTEICSRLHGVDLTLYIRLHNMLWFHGTVSYPIGLPSMK